MIPLAIPNISKNEGLNLQQCIETNFVSSVGPFVDDFERLVSQASGVAFSVATNAGTSALHLALTVLGVKQNELVILPSFTFIASANAISHCGALPWLFDVDMESWTLDTSFLEKALETQTFQSDGKIYHRESGKRVAAIMPVYTLGTPSNMDNILDISKKYNLPVVADAAAAIGSKYKNNNVGNLADLTVFSFNGNKTVTAGGGGMIVSDNEELISKARHLSTTARTGEDYNHDFVGYNYRMTNLQAAVGCAQMERLYEFVEAKQRISKTYEEALEDINGISLVPKPEWATSSCWLSGIVIDNVKNLKVKTICGELVKKGISTKPFWKPIHLQLPYSHSPKTTMFNCESFWHKILTLPCSTQLKEDEQKYVISTLNDLLR